VGAKAGFLKGLLRHVDSIQLTDIIWTMFIGIVQVEENKYRTTKKNHLPGTLELAFSLVADALNPDEEEAFIRGSIKGHCRFHQK